MKCSPFSLSTRALTFLLIAFLPLTKTNSQDFQRLYGTSLDNNFTKVIQHGSNYYVLGQDQPTSGSTPHATVTRLDANGIHQWTLSLNIPSAWNDAVLTPTGDLLVVGNTLPGDASNNSIMGLVTTSGGGNFTWLRTYDVPGREGLARIIRNPNPQNASFPYYVIGSQFDANGPATWDDIILMNINAVGTFNWKKRYTSVDDDEFGRDLEVLSNGDMMISGNHGSQGVIYKMDNAGTLINGITPSGLSFSYADVAQSSGGGFYAVGNTFPSFTPYLMKYDNNLLTVWDATISGLTSINQVWEESSGGIYVVGHGVFHGLSRAVLLRFTEVANAPSLDWVKYLDNSETSYSGGSTTYLTSGQIAFVDGRTPSTGGFGQLCAFMSVSDADLLSCMTGEDFTNALSLSLLYDAPALPAIEFFDFPTGSDILSAALNWQQEDVCDNNPCSTEFIITPIGNCGHYQVTTISNGASPFLYTWCDGSTFQNLDVQLPCGPNLFCVTITDSEGCTASYSESISVTDNIPPIARCALPFGIVLDSNCQYFLTPGQIDGGSSDNCQIQSLSISPAILTGCGVFPVTLTVTDWCGNTSTCTTDVQAIEDVPPVIVCPQNVTVTSTSPPPCSIVVNGLSWLSATDNCGTPFVDYVVTGATSNFGQNDASGLTYNQGVSTVTYTATDDCGNTSSCSFTVTVLCGSPGSIFKCGMAVVTCFSGYLPNSFTLAQPNGPVLALVDIRNHATAPLGINWYALSSSPSGVVHLPNWESKDMGQIFGVTIDDNYNVFTSSTTMYGRYLPTTLTNAVFGNVYKVDAATGAPGVFATLPQNLSKPAGLGDVWFDDQSSIKQIYVSNFFDGLIYRYDMSKNLLGTYDFPGTTFGTPTTGFVPLGERVWAVATYNGRLYFSVWNEDRSRPLPTLYNQIWSVKLDVSGAPLTGTEVLEKNLPNLVTITSNGLLTNDYSSPVSDISFSENGTMLIAERSMSNDFGNAAVNPGLQAHESRIFELSGPAWSVEKIFYVGNTNSLENSAGGIDYGYESFDPAVSPVPLLCDSIVWGTGDALRYTGFNAIPDASQPLGCSGGISDKVYGLAGIPQSGNSDLPVPANTYVKNSSIYIDLDNQICNADKAQIGDVDVFKNCISCPAAPQISCDSLMVMAEAVSSPDDALCCYSIDFKNLEGNISQICANLTTPGWVFNTGSLLLAGGYTWNTISATQLCIGHPGGIPMGNLQDILTFCLAEATPNAPPVQQIIFNWYIPGAVVCADTILTSCVPPINKDTCLIISDLHADCFGENDLEYCVTFNVTNTSNTPAYGFILGSLPPGLAYDDCGCGGSPYGNGGYLFSGFPVIPANSTQSFCVKIISTFPILTPTNVCFSASLEFGEDCCSSTEDWCVELKPCCDPCTSTAVVVHDLDSCCYALDFHYDCDFGFFTHIDIDILTPGVSFGSHANDPTWSVCTTPTLDHVCIMPFTGTIQSGTYNNLFSFCLTDINSPSEIPQQVLITYWTTGINGLDSMACDTILEFNCDYQSDTCVFVTNEQIECIADSMKYAITVTVQNLSSPNFTAYNLGILGPGITPNPIPLVPPLPNDGTTRTVTFCYTPNPWPDADGKLILLYRLKSLAGDTCCNGNQTFIDTLMLPSCCNTSRISLSSGWNNQNSTLLPAGGTDLDAAPDLDWLVITDPINPPPPGGRPADVVLPFGGWALPFAGSQWLSASPILYENQILTIPTDFRYEINFNLPTSFSNPHLSLQLRADELIRTVSLNNHVIYQYVPPHINGGFVGPPLILANSTAAYFNPLQNKLSIEYSDLSGTVTGINIAGSVSFCNDTCYCGTFSDMAIRFERGPGQPLTCGGPPVLIDCPPPGYSYTITGKFECEGNSCPTDIPFDAQLQLPNGTIINYTGQSATPYFGIPISNLDLQQAGIYTVTMTGHCGTQECKCVVRFQIDSPCIDLCPCDIPDIQAFSAAVNQGFAQVLYSKSCKACFTPIALDECETVQWYLTNTNGTPIGTSSGNNSFCYLFPGSGTYTVIMVATRKKDDGTNCETFVKSQTVTITCLNAPVCANSVFDNPTFSEGAITGGLNSGGHSDGWKANSGNPKLKEDQIASLDGWTMLLSGNLDTADVLTRLETICLEKSKGVLRGKTVKGSKSNSDNRLFPSQIKFYLGSKETFKFNLNECNGIDCYELASIALPVSDTGEWLELEVPYDLSNWEAFDTCGGVLVRPYVFVTNALSNSQGGTETYSYVEIDNLCIGGTLVAVEEPAQKQPVHIYPNPNTGEFYVEMTEPFRKGMTLRIISLTGQVLINKNADVGLSIQNMEASSLPEGMYFIQIISDGRLLSVDKFVKQ